MDRSDRRRRSTCCPAPPRRPCSGTPPRPLSANSHSIPRETRSTRAAAFAESGVVGSLRNTLRSIDHDATESSSRERCTTRVTKASSSSSIISSIRALKNPSAFFRPPARSPPGTARSSSPVALVVCQTRTARASRASEPVSDRRCARRRDETAWCARFGSCPGAGPARRDAPRACDARPRVSSRHPSSRKYGKTAWRPDRP